MDYDDVHMRVCWLALFFICTCEHSVSLPLSIVVVSEENDRAISNNVA